MSTPVSESRQSRERVFLTAIVAKVGSVAPLSCRVTNLSKCGVGLAQADEFTVKQRVRVTIGCVEEAAEVMWTRNGLAGLRFDHAIDPQAARQHKRTGAALPPRAGWAADLRNAYRK